MVFFFILIFSNGWENNPEKNNISGHEALRQRPDSLQS